MQHLPVYVGLPLALLSTLVMTVVALIPQQQPGLQDLLLQAEREEDDKGKLCTQTWAACNSANGKGNASVCGPAQVADSGDVTFLRSEGYTPKCEFECVEMSQKDSAFKQALMAASAPCMAAPNEKGDHFCCIAHDACEGKKSCSSTITYPPATTLPVRSCLKFPSMKPEDMRADSEERKEFEQQLKTTIGVLITGVSESDVHVNDWKADEEEGCAEIHFSVQVPAVNDAAAVKFLVKVKEEGKKAKVLGHEADLGQMCHPMAGKPDPEEPSGEPPCPNDPNEEPCVSKNQPVDAPDGQPEGDHFWKPAVAFRRWQTCDASMCTQNPVHACKPHECHTDSLYGGKNIVGEIIKVHECANIGKGGEWPGAYCGGGVGEMKKPISDDELGKGWVRDETGVVYLLWLLDQWVKCPSEPEKSLFQKFKSMFSSSKSICPPGSYVGLVYGRPKFGEGVSIKTSKVEEHSDEGWIKTKSGSYYALLGPAQQPLPESEWVRTEKKFCNKHHDFPVDVAGEKKVDITLGACAEECKRQNDCEGFHVTNINYHGNWGGKLICRLVFGDFDEKCIPFPHDNWDIYRKKIPDSDSVATVKTCKDEYSKATCKHLARLGCNTNTAKTKCPVSCGTCDDLP